MMGMLFFLVGEIAMLKWSMKQVQIEEKAGNFLKNSGVKSITGDICSRLTKKLSRALDISEDGTHLYVRDRHWALETYGFFWENLLVKQEASPASKLRCLAFHSSDLNIWLEEKGIDFLSYQKRFIDAGGVVERVLCDDGQNPELLDKVVNKMKECGIDVYYYNAKKGGDDFAWDFLIVDNQSVMWVDTLNIGHKPETAVYTNNGKYEDNDLYERWRKYRDKSELK
jgi:transposase